MRFRRASSTSLIFAAIVVILVAGALGVTIMLSSSSSSSSTSTSSSTSSSGSSSSSTETTSSTTTTSSESSSSTTSSLQGIQLTASVNATTIQVGQSLNVSLSIFNTLSSVNAVTPSSAWAFQGVPVALWPACYFHVPAQVVVLDGNYSLSQLPGVANDTFSYVCMEGVNVDHVIFQPNSDQANLTGIYDVTGANQTLGPFQLGLSFTTAGSWELLALSQQLNPPVLGSAGSSTIASTPFSPGAYTVAVADEWGQAVLLHIEVIPSSTTTSSSSTSYSCTISGEPGGLYLRVLSDSTDRPVVGAQVTATNQPAYCDSSPADNQTTQAFTTTNQEWYFFNGDNNAGYHIVVQYSGESYTLNPTLSPVSLTCVTLFVPSGTVSETTLEFQTACPSGSASDPGALRLQLSVNASTVYVGQTIGVNVSELNTLLVENNVSSSHGYLIPVALSSCPNTNVQPFGIALYSGHYTSQNVSQGTQIQIFPPTVCPMYERYVSGYLFQPGSDLATILPGSGLTPMSSTVDIVNGTSSGGQFLPLPPGEYTLVAADEWGNAVFVYFQVLAHP